MVFFIVEVYCAFLYIVLLWQYVCRDKYKCDLYKIVIHTSSVYLTCLVQIPFVLMKRRKPISLHQLSLPKILRVYGPLLYEQILVMYVTGFTIMVLGMEWIKHGTNCEDLLSHGNLVTILQLLLLHQCLCVGA